MTFIYNMADTWNDIGTTFNAIYMNVSDGAAGPAVGAADSRMFRLDDNGVTQFDIDIDGRVRSGENIDVLFPPATYSAQAFFTREITVNPGVLYAEGANNSLFASYVFANEQIFGMDNGVIFNPTASGLCGFAAGLTNIVYDTADDLDISYVTGTQTQLFLLHGTGGTVDEASGLQSFTTMGGVTDVDRSRGLDIRSVFRDDSTTNEHRHINIKVTELLDAATLTDNYGLYIEDQAGIADTLNYNIYSAGRGLIVLGGNTLVGSVNNPEPLNFTEGGTLGLVVYDDNPANGYNYASIIKKANTVNDWVSSELAYAYIDFSGNPVIQTYAVGSETHDESDPTTSDYYIYDYVNNKYAISARANDGAIYFGAMADVSTPPSDAIFIINPAAEATLTNNQSLVGNVANFTNAILNPGDPLHEVTIPYTDLLTPLSVDNYFSGDLTDKSISAFNAAIGIKHTGVGFVSSTGIDFQPSINSDSTGGVSPLNAYFAGPRNYGTGLVTFMSGYNSVIFNLGETITQAASFIATTVVDDSSGTTPTIIDASGFYVEVPFLVGAGNITNNYGIYINDQSGIADTLNYNIYSAGDGLNQFAGKSILGSAIVPDDFLTDDSRTTLLLNDKNLGGFSFNVVQVATKAVGASAAGGEMHFGAIPFASNEVVAAYAMGGYFTNADDLTTGIYQFLDVQNDVYKIAMHAADGIIRFGSLDDLEPISGIITLSVDPANNTIQVVDAPDTIYPGTTFATTGTFVKTYDADPVKDQISSLISYLNINFNPTAAGIFGFNNEVIIQPGVTGTIAQAYGMYNSVDNIGDPDITDLSGARFDLFNEGNSPSVVTAMYGFQANTRVFNSGATTTIFGARIISELNDTHAVGTLYGMSILAPFVSGTPTVTNNYGLYIGDQSGIADTLNYNIYSAGAGYNYMGGALLDSTQVLIGNHVTFTTIDSFPGDPVLEVTGPLTGAFSNIAVSDYISEDLSNKVAITFDTYKGVKHTGIDPGYFYALNLNPSVNSDSTGPFSYVSGVNSNTINAGEGDVTNLNAFYAEVYQWGSGLVTNAAAVFADGAYLDDLLGGGITPIITNNYGVRILAAYLVGSGTSIVNNYGLYIGDQSGIGDTLNYNIYSAGDGINYFGGSIYTAQVNEYFGSVDLGATWNFYSGNAGSRFSVQVGTPSNGDSLFTATHSGTVSGNVYGCAVQLDCTSDGIFSVQQNGSGNAVFDMLVLGAGDAACRMAVNGVTDWSMGLDNSDSDKFKISQSINLGTNDYFIIDTSGVVRIPVSLRIDQTPTANTSAASTITNGADSATNLGHRIQIDFNGTPYWIPCSSVAF